MYLALRGEPGDALGFALLMGSGIGVMYVYYSTVVLDDSGCRRAVAARHGDGVVLLRDVSARRVARPARHRASPATTSRSKAAAAANVAPARSLAELAADLLPTLVGRSKLGVLPAVEPYRAAGLHTAMYIVPILAAILAVVLFMASRTVKRDVEKVQDWMRSSKAQL